MTKSLHTELWTSWASLLRSYAAAHGLNAVRQAIVEVGIEVIVVRSGIFWLEIRTDHQGFGGINLSNGAMSPFAIRENGQVLLYGNWIDMDMAAEQLIREILEDSRADTGSGGSK